jgi:hypothetical protein
MVNGVSVQTSNPIAWLRDTKNSRRAGNPGDLTCSGL